MQKLFSDNLKVISGLILCSSNDIGVSYFEPMVFSHKYVASEFSGTCRISWLLAVEISAGPSKPVFIFSGAKHEAQVMLLEGKSEHTVNPAGCPSVQRNRYMIKF